MKKGDMFTFEDRKYECWTELSTGWFLIRLVDDILSGTIKYRPPKIAQGESTNPKFNSVHPSPGTTNVPRQSNISKLHER